MPRCRRRCERYSGRSSWPTPAADATRRELRARLQRRRSMRSAPRASASSRRGRRARARPPSRTYSYKVRDRVVTGENYTESLSHQRRCRSSPCRSLQRLGRDAALPAQRRICRAPIPTPAASIRTAARRRTRRACSPARARRSAPTGASTTSRGGHGAARLSTAFDSTTLYGEDPDTAPGHLRHDRQLRRVASRRSTT